MTSASPSVFPEIPGYRIEAEIGRGASARVFSAEQTGVGRRVALKVIAAIGEAGRRRAQRLGREARLGGTVDCPEIVRILDAGATGDLAWIAMDLVEGESLDDRLEKKGAMGLDEVLRLGQDLLRAVLALHQRRIVHRDIKPGNILLGTDGRARLIDLGLARQLGQESRLTQDRSGLGTPLYMAPEQIRDATDADERADIYALGATLYHALAGRPPFEAGSVTALLEAALRKSPAPPSHRRSELTPEWDAVVMRCLRKPRRARYRTIQALAEDWAALADGRRTTARRRVLVSRAAIGVAGAAGVIATVLAISGGSPEAQERDEAAPKTAPAPIRSRAVETAVAEVASAAEMAASGTGQIGLTFAAEFGSSVRREVARLRSLATAARAGATAPSHPPQDRVREAIGSGRLKEARGLLDGDGPAIPEADRAQLARELSAKSAALDADFDALLGSLTRSGIDPLPEEECIRRAQEFRAGWRELEPRLVLADPDDRRLRSGVVLALSAEAAVDHLGMTIRRLEPALREKSTLVFRPEIRKDRLLPPREIKSIDGSVLVCEDAQGLERSYALRDLSVLSLADLWRCAGHAVADPGWVLHAHWTGEPGEAAVLAAGLELPGAVQDAVWAADDAWARSRDTAEARELSGAIVAACRELGAGRHDQALELLAVFRRSAVLRSERRQVQELLQRARRLESRIHGGQPSADHPGALFVYEDAEAEATWVRFEPRGEPAGWSLSGGVRADLDGLDFPEIPGTAPLRLEELPSATRVLTGPKTGVIQATFVLAEFPPGGPGVLGVAVGGTQIWLVRAARKDRPPPSEPLHGIWPPPPELAVSEKLGVAGLPFPAGDLFGLAWRGTWAWPASEGLVRLRVQVDARKGTASVECGQETVRIAPLPEGDPSAGLVLGLCASGPFRLVRVDLQEKGRR